jgi:hypothetical protein
MYGGPVSVQSPCVPVEAGKEYDFGALVLMPNTAGVAGKVQLSWTQRTDCTGSFTTVDAPSPDSSRTGSWQWVGSSATAPSGAAGAQLVLTASTALVPEGGAANTSVLFDDVYLSLCPGGF